MNFEDILFETFETEDVTIENLYEGFLPITPALAFLTFKRNVLKNLHKAGKNVDDALEKSARGVKSKGLIAKEKARASVGKNSGVGDDATVYKLTKEQMDVLSEIHENYGNKLIDDVMEFRKNILAPYQLIKRMVKSNKVVTAKDKFGMTNAQFKAAVESGKKKIEKRGTHFQDEKVGQEKVKELDRSIDDLRELLADYKKTGTLKESIVNRVLKNYNLAGSDFENVSLEDLRKTYDELKKNHKSITSLIRKSGDGLDVDDIKASNDLVKRNIELRKGIIKKERAEKEKEKENVNEEFTNIPTLSGFKEFNKNGSFNIALAKYMLRRNIIDELHAGSNPVLKKMYEAIIREMIKESTERHLRLVKKRAGDRGKIEFNDIERRIFKLKASQGSEYSGNVDDYVQVIKDEDFSNPKYIKRPQGVVNAEKKIEAEIKKFERALKKELDPEDYEKLKRYRLINNLITVKDLKSPDKLFKSPQEMKSTPEENTEE